MAEAVYVDPPSHLKRSEANQGGGIAPSELRTVPDYDYSLFRYSKLALPFLGLIFITATLLVGLTFWQGPWGVSRAGNGLQDGVPRDFEIKYTESQAPDTHDHESGLNRDLRNFRFANFVLGLIPLLILVFTIRMQATPGALRALFAVSIILLFVVAVLATVAFGMAVDQVNEIRECPDKRFLSSSPSTNLGRDEPCTRPRSVAVAGAVSDALLAFTSFLLVGVLIFTILSNNYAWGPGRVSVKKSPLQPQIDFPPETSFTKIHETRRAYVWLLLAVFAAALILNITITLIIHEMRAQVIEVDNNNLEVQTSGWPVRNNRFRLGVSMIIILLVFISLLDYIGTKRRALAYLVAILLFFSACALFVVFGFDVDKINKAQDLPCRKDTVLGFGGQLRCAYHPYQGTASVEFLLALIIFIYLVYEFVYRVLATWDTYYFYADSEWLRNHSLFVDSTDRVAYDWKKFQMETGKEYYYSPTLGIATRQRPAGFIDPDAPVAYNVAV
eukprot:NODE_728_length_1681_cov_278.929215_g718_i0.p2 GENE.NODE_728_length_1681_cov_278.929215_g718_i0~~NODE_728_length_1681_cov_278.929215_g718_i0.p2  ORF type:complete len:528 (-),score=139.87 NODE_728_length_1681_cov_278.929215_g718_i0:97-1599(-)